MRALMLDNENLSLRPDGVVLSIGYCVADLDTGKYLEMPRDIYVDLQTQENAGRHFMASTVQWWMQQGEHARAAAFPQGVSPLSPSEARRAITDLVNAYGVADGKPAKDFTVWAKPSHMDIPQLKSLFGDREPWAHWQVRDLYTMQTVFDPYGLLKPPTNALAHVASADANWQMDYLIALWKRRNEMTGFTG